MAKKHSPKSFREREVAAIRREATIPIRKPTPPNPVLIKRQTGERIVAQPTSEEAQDSVVDDIAESVGRSIAAIVNRIESLDKERATLIAKLEEARTKLNEQFNKWLPAGLTGSSGPVGLPNRGAGRKREVTIGTPCRICGFATLPYHDARLKTHRDQGENKKPLTDEQLARLGLMKSPTTGTPIS